MTLGDCIKEYRDRMGLSQRKFAEMCGLSNAYISILEKNINPKTGEEPTPSFGGWKKVADAMGISMQDLMEKADETAVFIGSNTMIDPAYPIHQEALQYIGNIARSYEDGELERLWKDASPAAKKAALAVLKSFEEPGED
jgi:transcriptional regulator with XRE-family HTH domain